MAVTVGTSNVAVPDKNLFDVPKHIFRRLQPGKVGDWPNFLDDEDEYEKKIKEFAIENPEEDVYVRNTDSGRVRRIRRDI